jgi:DNA-binding response OmpR family regulator
MSSANSRTQPLHEPRQLTTLLIVEDNLVIADLVEALLTQDGYAVCGIARTVDEAVALCHSRRPDYAIVDLRLADHHRGNKLAGRLGTAQRIGILFASSNGANIPLTSADGIAFIQKPYRPEDLLRALAIVIDIRTTGASLLPHPNGFRLLGVAAA